MVNTPQEWLSHLATLDFEGHDEASIREQWIYPLLTLLGYGDPRHRVDIPFKVDLADPVRAIGSHRYEVDYRPTVYGVGMWIIEAKKPAEDLFSSRHLGQAWSYATHPEIDVPFIVMPNGQCICVYDITKPDWDKEPEIDIVQIELPGKFAQLDEVLGARRVADFVRRRQLRHLRTALMAQLDEGVLDQTVRDVEAIVADVRPTVRRNHSTVFLEAFEVGLAERERSAREIGVLGLAYSCISPNVPITADIESCAQIVRDLDADRRASAFDDFAAAAQINGAERMTWGLRVLRLGVALRLVDDEVCGEHAREVAEAAAHDAATGLSAEPVAVAAHEFERVLPAFIARLVLTNATDDAFRLAQAVKEHMDVEAWIRRDATVGLGAGAILDRQIELAFRAAWTQFAPWTEDALREATAEIRRLLAQLPIRRDVRVGQVNNAFYETGLEHDPLRPGTRNIIREIADPAVFTSEAPEIAARSAFAGQLLDRYSDQLSM